MKITRRSDKGKGGHLLISVPANRVAEVEAALRYLEARRNRRGSQVVIDLIVRAAKRNGWTFTPSAEQAPPELSCWRRAIGNNLWHHLDCAPQVDTLTHTVPS